MPIVMGEDGIPFIEAEELVTLPIEQLDELRKSHPALRTHPIRVSLLRAKDVQKLSGDARLVQVPGAQFCDAMGIASGYCRSFLENFMLMSNGADHQRMRGAFARTFSHPMVRSRREQVRAVADRIVADLPRGEDFDFLALCSSRLPAEVIAEVLGLPVEESGWFAVRSIRSAVA